MSDKWTSARVSRMVVNPFYAIEIAPHLCEAHTPLVSEELWIEANATVIREVGPEAYLRALLTTLKEGEDEGMTKRATK